SRGLVQGLDPALLGQRIVDGARDLLGGHRATLLCIEPDVGELTIVAISGADAECAQPPRFPETYEIAAWAIEARRLTIIPDFLADPRLAGFSQWRADAERAIDRAFFAIPLLVQDQAIGAIVVTHRIGWSVEGEALGLIQAFAGSAALALENARLYGEATRRRHEAEELARVARLLTETLDFPTVANRIAEVVWPLLRVPASVVPHPTSRRLACRNRERWANSRCLGAGPRPSARRRDRRQGHRRRTTGDRRSSRPGRCLHRGLPSAAGELGHSKGPGRTASRRQDGSRPPAGPRPVPSGPLPNP